MDPVSPVGQRALPKTSAVSQLCLKAVQHGWLGPSRAEAPGVPESVSRTAFAGVGAPVALGGQ